MEETKHTEIAKTEEPADCCGPKLEVKGRSVSMKWVLIGGGILIFTLLLLTGYGSAIWGFLPFLLILACPLMHVFMHGGKGHKH